MVFIQYSTNPKWGGQHFQADSTWHSLRDASIPILFSVSKSHKSRALKICAREPLHLMFSERTVNMSLASRNAGTFDGRKAFAFSEAQVASDTYFLQVKRPHNTSAQIVVLGTSCYVLQGLHPTVVPCQKWCA